MEITFDKVSYTYQPNTPFEHQAIKDISFHIPSGKFVAIIGHTGSGKSTLIQHLNGLLRPTAGSMNIGGFELKKEKKPKNMKMLRSKVGIVFQYPEHQLFEETVEKDIAFGPTNFDVPEAAIQKRTKKVMTQVGLDETLLQRSPFELSGGQMRRAAIAGVLATDPDVYVLDEPTAGLDPRGQKEMMDMFYNIHQEAHKTMILVTHSMEDAWHYADEIIILNKGGIFLKGTPEEIFEKDALIRGVQLDMPQSVDFVNQFNSKMNSTLPVKRQTAQELAEQIKSTLGDSHG